MTRKRRINKQLGEFKRRQPISLELKKEEQKPKRNNYIFLILVAIVCLTLLFNTYFNYTSGIAINENGKTLGEKYYLLGPDPYYHARIAEHIYNTGEVPYWQEGSSDPLLDYPMEQRNPRPPLFDFTLAIGAHVLSPFMDDIDALGHSIQFLPALFGALLIIPVYLIATLLFNRRVGLVSAFFIAIIPIHLGSGHGSAYALADHDSWLLLLSTIGLYFFLKALTLLKDETNSIKELIFTNKKAIMYATLTGVIYSAIALSWEGFKFVVVLLMLYTVLQLFLNCYFKRNFLGITLLGTIPLVITSVLITPYYFVRGTFNDVEIVLSLIGIILFVGLLFHYTKDKIPYIITLPSLVAGGVAFLYLVNIYQIKPFFYFVGMFFKGTVYVGKVSLTIAEAGTVDMSTSIMGFGPALYWVAWFGAIIFMATTLIHKKYYMYFMSLYFLLIFYFTMTAGRFLNDFVPFIAIFAGWTTIFIIEKIDYKKLILAFKSATGFSKIKAIKISHVLGIVFIAFVLIFPNVVLAFDTAIPWQEKENYDFLSSSAYGISFGKEQYWTDAFSWLAKQDTDLLPEDRPAFISWWDYGFYEVHIGKHPTVADNFQDGIEVAANFKTATTEKEAISVLIARFVFADFKVNNEEKGLSAIVKDVLTTHLNETNSNNIEQWLINPDKIPLYLAPSCEKYEPELSETYKIEHYNAYYHSFCDLTESLTDENVTQFYMDMQEATGWNIRYYGTEQYDNSIFSVFTFLSDKSLMPVGGLEDDYYVGYYVGTYKDTTETKKFYSEDLNNLTVYEQDRLMLRGPYFDRKPAFYQTMFYKTFFGTPVNDGSIPTNRIPCYGLKHFVAKYISSYVTIAKYYEGYKVDGNVFCQNMTLPGINVVVFDEYGIPHDSTLTMDEGYNVIVPAGINYLSLYLGEHPLKTITLNVTEDQAMRLTTIYNETINFDVQTVNLNGTVYQNETVVKNEDVTLVGQMTGMFTRIKTDENGCFEFNDIAPNYYKIVVSEQEYNIIVYENMSYNVAI